MTIKNVWKYRLCSVHIKYMVIIYGPYMIGRLKRRLQQVIHRLWTSWPEVQIKPQLLCLAVSCCIILCAWVLSTAVNVCVGFWYYCTAVSVGPSHTALEAFWQNWVRSQDEGIMSQSESLPGQGCHPGAWAVCPSHHTLPWIKIH